MIKIAFVGVGAIGRRHIKNTAAYLSEKGLSYCIDVYRSGSGRELDADIKALITKQYSIEDDITGIYDAVFITNPTSMHYETLKRFSGHGKSFFIEKPVFDAVAVDMGALAQLDPDKCYVACPLRYNPVIQYVKENVDLSKVIAVQVESSSYLPDWRPGTDYRKCYSAHKDMGGGVDIDLIHEWDYLTYLFGSVKSGYALADKVSALEIDSNDIAVYIAKTETTVIELHLDYFGRKASRKLKLFTNDEVIECDILNGRVTYPVSGKTVELDAERNAFQIKEIGHFFDICLGGKKSDSTVAHGITVLKYAKGEF